jgi:hypothetical protein
MLKFIAILIVLALFYIGIGILVEFVFLKKTDKELKYDAETALRIITWPKRLKDI